MPLYAFAEFTLDTDLHELRMGKGAIALQPKVYGLLAHFVTAPDCVLAKDDLLERVWGDVNVTPSSLTRAISVLRETLQRAGGSQQIVRTVRGAGYALGVPVARIDPLPERHDAMRRRALDFVEREPELTVLHHALDESLLGRGGLALISGRPGIGKSRLLREFAWQAERRGAQLIWARGGELESHVSYGLWMQVVHSALLGCEAQVRTALGAAADDLAPLAWPSSCADDAHAQHADQRLRMFQAVASLLALRAAERPVLLLLDDLQAADPASLALLEYLAHRITCGPLLVAAAFRDRVGSRETGFGQRASDLMRAGCRAERIALGGLSAPSVEELAERLGYGRPGARDLALLMQATGGSPLLVRDWLRGSDAMQDFDDVLILRPSVSEGRRRHAASGVTEAA